MEYIGTYLNDLGAEKLKIPRYCRMNSMVRASRNVPQCFEIVAKEASDKAEISVHRARMGLQGKLKYRRHQPQTGSDSWQPLTLQSSQTKEMKPTSGSIGAIS